MILTGKKIDEEVQSNRINIDPYDPRLLNPNSYNFRLGNHVKVYKSKTLDSKIVNDVKSFILPEKGYKLEANKLYLINTYEKISTDFYVPLIGGRSSTGRLGLFVHITAPLGDIGYKGHWTLQLNATVPLIVYPKQKIGQVIFVKPYGKINLYKGKYQNGKVTQEYAYKSSLF